MTDKEPILTDITETTAVMCRLNNKGIVPVARPSRRLLPTKTSRFFSLKTRPQVALVAVLLAIVGACALLGPSATDLESLARKTALLWDVNEGEVLEAIPSALRDNLADLSDPEQGYLPVFWHVLKSGGTAVQDICVLCLGLTAASEIGALKGHGEDLSLRILEINFDQKHVNVDTTVVPGMERAKKLGLAESRLAEVLFTPLLIETADIILDKNHKGRMFAMFRHPLDRAVSQFYYLRHATWEPTYNPQLLKMNITTFAHSPLVESNWMVRSLVGKMEAGLTEEDIAAAKEIIKTKCLVGLMDRMEESVERFRQYFGFDIKKKDNAISCINQFTSKDGKRGNRNRHPNPLVEGDSAWNELAKKNHADISLYELAEQLFKDQSALVDK